MINFGCEFLKKKGCNDVSLWMQGSKNFEKQLKKNQFKIKNSRPFICKIFEKNLYLENKLNKKNWYFNMGDSLEIY